MNKTLNYLLFGLKVLVALAFFSAGAAKLVGVEMMIANFEKIGLGQWFRYVTGGLEVVCAILLFIPGKQAVAAILLVCTMIGAIIAHLTILGPSSLPALLLGILCAIILYAHRDQIPGQRWS